MKKLSILFLFISPLISAQDTVLDYKELLKIIPSEIEGFLLIDEPQGVNVIKFALQDDNFSILSTN